MDRDKSFAEWLRSRRVQRGLSQDQMARWLDVPYVTYGRWERGNADPTWTTLLKLFGRLGEYPVDLLESVVGRRTTKR